MVSKIAVSSEAGVVKPLRTMTISTDPPFSLTWNVGVANCKRASVGLEGEEEER